MPGLGLDTVIAGSNKGVKELNKHNYPKVPANVKNIQMGNKILQTAGSALNLGQQDFMLKAKEMLYRIENAKVLKGRSIDSKVALVIFMTARNLKRPKKPKEIMEYIRTSEDEINKCYKVLNKAGMFGAVETRLLPVDIVEKEGGSNKLNLPPDVLQAAKRTAIKFKEEGVCEGKKP
jgi:transcription initiation factor TFIIIB Brf1 subunit/transcription initiation factor TFIIB